MIDLKQVLEFIKKNIKELIYSYGYRIVKVKKRKSKRINTVLVNKKNQYLPALMIKMTLN